jgi:hypothetical protein
MMARKWDGRVRTPSSLLQVWRGLQGRHTGSTYLGRNLRKNGAVYHLLSAAAVTLPSLHTTEQHPQKSFSLRSMFTF